MLRAIGFVITLVAVSTFMSEAFTAFEKAIAATFQTVEVAAVISKHELLDMSN